MTDGLHPNADGTICLVGYLSRSHRRQWTQVRGGWCLCDDCAREWDWDGQLPPLNLPRIGDLVTGNLDVTSIATGAAGPAAEGTAIDLNAAELEDNDTACIDDGLRHEEGAAAE